MVEVYKDKSKFEIINEDEIIIATNIVYDDFKHKLLMYFNGAYIGCIKNCSPTWFIRATYEDMVD